MYQRKKLEKAKKEAGARAEKEADEQRTKEWINERKRREQVRLLAIPTSRLSLESVLQEQLERAEGASVRLNQC